MNETYTIITNDNIITGQEPLYCIRDDTSGKSPNNNLNHEYINIHNQLLTNAIYDSPNI